MFIESLASLNRGNNGFEGDAEDLCSVILLTFRQGRHRRLPCANTPKDRSGSRRGRFRRVSPKFCVNIVEWWKTEQKFLGRQRRRPLPPWLQHNAGGGGCQGRRLCAVHQSAVFQAARRPLTSGTVGVIPASGRRNTPPFGRGSYSSPGVGLSTSS